MTQCQNIIHRGAETGFSDAEFMGWAAVAEGVLTEAEQHIIVVAEEPRDRAELEATYAAELAGIASRFALHITKTLAVAACITPSSAGQCKNKEVHEVEGRRHEEEEKYRLTAAEAREAAESLQLLYEEQERAVAQLKESAVRLTELQAEATRVEQYRHHTEAELYAAWEECCAEDEGAPSADESGRSSDGGSAREGEEGEELGVDADGLLSLARRLRRELRQSRRRNVRLAEELSRVEAAKGGEVLLMHSGETAKDALCTSQLPASESEIVTRNDAYDDDVMLVEDGAPVYRRILQSPRVNPVTASLLRAKQQIDELRGPSLGRITNAVSSPMPHAANDGMNGGGTAAAPRGAAAVIRGLQPAQTPRPKPGPLAGAGGAGTPLTVTPVISRALYLQYTPLRTSGAAAPAGRSHASEKEKAEAGGNEGSSSQWKERMTQLQVELKELRRDLGATHRRR